MGTACTHKPAGMSLDQFFKDKVFRWGDDLPDRYTVLATAYKAPCLYAAVEQLNKKTGERRVWAAVTKVRFHRADYHNLCYKDMSENEGPYYHDCPARILDLLTPSDNEYANEWRENCRKKIAKAAEARARKIEAGTVLMYGGKRYTVTEKAKFGWCKVHDDRGVPYRMRPGQVRRATLVACD